MAVVNKFNVNKQQVTLDADIIENMSANDVSYNDSFQYDENTVGDKLSKLGSEVIYDVTANNDGAVFESLSSLLSSSNLSTLIPTSVRCGGMTIRFIQSSDNKYVQYRLMTTSFSTIETDWQGIDNEPTADSENLVTSGGVSEKCLFLNDKRFDVILPNSIFGNNLDEITNSPIYSYLEKSYYKKNASNKTISQVSTNDVDTILILVDDYINDICKINFISNYPAINNIVFGVNETTAAIIGTEYSNYVVIEGKNTIINSIPEGTVFIALTIVPSDKNIALQSLRITSNKKRLKWLLVGKDNLDFNFNEDITTINPDKLYDGEYVFEKKLLPIQTEEGVYYSQVSDIDIQRQDAATLSSIAVDVDGSDILLYKSSVNISVTQYYNFIVFCTDTIAPVIKKSEIGDYVTVIDSTQFIYKIRVPEGAKKFYTLSSTHLLSEVKIEKITTQRFYPWIKVDENNLSKNISDYLKAQVLKNINENLPSISSSVKTEIEIDNKVFHLWDSIKKPIDFNNKTLVAFGDSITSGVSSPEYKVIEECYIKLFCDYVGVGTLVNYAISGSKFVNSSGSSIYNKVLSYNGVQPDIIVIAGGTNDWNQGASVGIFGEDDDNTVYGALKGICEHLQSKYQNATVIFITPIPYTLPDSSFPNHTTDLNYYRTAIYDVATYYGYNVVSGLGLGMPREIGGWNHTMCDDSDGCHPTARGHALYARSLAGKLL